MSVEETPNKPLEWTGPRQCSASPPHALCLPLRGSVQILELLIIHDYSGRFSALPSQPTNKPQLSPGLQVSEVEVNHPFGNRSSQKAAPRLQIA